MARKKTHQYNVRVRVTGFMDITVEATDEEEAGKKAEHEVTLDCMTEWSVDGIEDVELDAP